jgi:hypothetical protein
VRSGCLRTYRPSGAAAASRAWHGSVMPCSGNGSVMPCSAYRCSGGTKPWHRRYRGRTLNPSCG